MAALYTDNIQKPASRPDYCFGEVTQPSESRLNENRTCHTLELTFGRLIHGLKVSSTKPTLNVSGSMPPAHAGIKRKRLLSAR